MMRRLTRLISGLQVFPERMRSNLESSHGLVFSQPVLLALVEGGLSRDDAYRVVQRNAIRAWDERVDFRKLLESDPDVGAIDLDAAFDLSRSLRHLDQIFDRVDDIVIN
jgi:adenylosuccinate lyase